ncbi:ferredoxin-NADP reductase [Rhodococcus rhodochrous J38]|uniref:PDR/VanB family oxidoreductase n=1 Tax=Rhodococcus rhodochrous TaxID=1829 RepID=UPI0011A5FE70|nr:PDR/VanB family oxidoreductase [Rhodococcus rhodochrous]TWH52401.1 ferredoxin-NADP reductase [Rhodococcus rhodochrous J38]
MTQETSRLVVRQQRLESDGVLSLTLEHPEGAALDEWEPGAHIDLVLPSGTVRQYSLCGDPEDKTAYRIAVLKEEQGRGGSKEIHDSVRVGDLLAVRGPRNHFALEPAPHYLLIAGGIGITPILSMARKLSRENASWSALYGGRSRATMAFVEEICGLGEVDVCPADEFGNLDLAGAVADVPVGTAVYCCGPEGLLQAVKSVCGPALGDEAIHFERFGAPVVEVDSSEAADASEGQSPTEFEVELRRTGCTLKVPADRTLLEVVLEANPNILYSCEDGFCGSCETRVLDGVPEHHDSILSQADRDKGQTMMICVGRSRTPTLVLDA